MDELDDIATMRRLMSVLGKRSAAATRQRMSQDEIRDRMRKLGARGGRAGRGTRKPRKPKPAV